MFPGGLIQINKWLLILIFVFQNKNEINGTNWDNSPLAGSSSDVANRRIGATTMHPTKNRCMGRERGRTDPSFGFGSCSALMNRKLYEVCSLSHAWETTKKKFVFKFAVECGPAWL